MGLDESYSSVRSNILMNEPLPSVKSAFAICSREESYKSASSGVSPNRIPNSAFLGKVNDKKRFPNSNNNNRTNLVCKNCGIKGHTIERCYKLIGFPKDFKTKTDSQPRNFSNNSVFSESKSESADNEKPDCFPNANNNPFCFSIDQVSKLLSLINDKPGFNPVANMAGVNLSFIHHNVKWVIDSGANQHFTTSDKFLDNVVDISDLKLQVDHPNGSSANILKIGNLSLDNSVGLYDVLVVPDFNVNLMSVHKVVKDNKLRVIFDEDKCYFQDSLKDQIMGTGNEQGGLYVYNQGNSNKSNIKNNMVCCISKSV